MKKEKILLISFLFFIFIFVNIHGFKVVYYEMYDIEMLINPPNKTIFKPGEKIEFTVDIKNNVGYIFDGYLITTLVYGCDKPYPLDPVDCGVITQTNILPIKISSGDEKTVNINIKIPEDARKGIWRVDFYLMGESYGVKGNYVAYDPYYYFTFNVEEEGGRFPKITILQSKTHIAGGFLQSGPMVKATENIPGYIKIKNLDNEKFNGKIEFYICKFDDYLGNCKLFKEETISIPPKESKGIIYYLSKDIKPGAYTILYKVYENGKLHGTYKNRIIIEGKTINILSLKPDKESYKKGEMIVIRAVLTGNYYPATSIVENITVELLMLSNENKTIYREKRFIDKLEVDDIKVLLYVFNATERLEGYYLCLKAYSSDVKTQQCLHFGSKKVEEDIVSPIKKPEETKKPENTLFNTLFIVAIILLIAIMLIIVMKVTRKNLVMLILLGLLLILPISFAGITCPGFKYYYDVNKNGIYDSDIDVDITNKISNLKKGNAQYLPLHTIVRAEGTCNGYVSVHWCSNTARRSEYRSYDHKITVINGTGELVLVETYKYDISDLTKKDIIETIKNNTYKSIDFEEKDASILENLSINYIPDLTPYVIEPERLENIIINQTLTNYCNENNCTYEIISTAQGKIYNTTHEFYISWENVFRELQDKIHLVIEKEWVQQGNGNIILDKGEYFVITTPGFYTLKHVY